MFYSNKHVDLCQTRLLDGRDESLQLPRSFWISVGIAVLFNSLFLALVIVKPGTQRQFTIADDVGQALGWLLATLFCFVGFKKLWIVNKSFHSTNFATSHGLLTWVPLLIALGIFSQFIGQVIYTYDDLMGLPPVIALSVFIWRSGGNGVLEQGVYIGGIVRIGLLLFRQFFAIRETTFYNQQLRVTQQDLFEKNQALRVANLQLEEQATQVEEAYSQQVYLNELKDDFLLNVNHELRTPLTAIYGFLDLLREYHGQLDSSMELTLINQAVYGCEELQQLVSNVLDTLQGDFKEKEPSSEVFSLATIAYEVINLFEPQKSMDYIIKLDISENLFVKADRQYVRQVLLNLLSNAFKYSPSHTTIEIRAREYDNSPVNKSSQSLVCISVKDAGLGIPPSESPLLFGKFVRLKRDLVGSVRGTGLGLYISKQPIEEPGGVVRSNVLEP